jgi:hypothetical protein
VQEPANTFLWVLYNVNIKAAGTAVVEAFVAQYFLLDSLASPAQPLRSAVQQHLHTSTATVLATGFLTCHPCQLCHLQP